MELDDYSDIFQGMSDSIVDIVKRAEQEVQKIFEVIRK